jgi:hypothetical protein
MRAGRKETWRVRAWIGFAAGFRSGDHPQAPDDLSEEASIADVTQMIRKLDEYPRHGQNGGDPLDLVPAPDRGKRPGD